MSKDFEIVPSTRKQNKNEENSKEIKNEETNKYIDNMIARIERLSKDFNVDKKVTNEAVEKLKKYK
jgi:hypothetical protein